MLKWSIYAGPLQVTPILQLRNPEVPIVRNNKQTLLRSREELLPSRAERSARLARQAALRHWAQAGGRPRGLALGALQAVKVAFTGEVDEQKLRQVWPPTCCYSNTAMQGAWCPSVSSCSTMEICSHA